MSVVTKLFLAFGLSAFLLTGCSRISEKDLAVKNGDKYKLYTYWWTPVLNKGDLLGYDIEIFKETPVWKLAKAVYRQDTLAIIKICQKDTSLLSVKDDIVGITLLDWAVFNNRYFSAKALLEAGADPNVHLGGIETPFMTAADKNETANYTRLLLKHGGNPNDTVQHKDFFVTPLHVAVSSNLESTKLLVEAGANVNISDSDNSIFSWAALHGNMNILLYLIQKGADYTQPVHITDGKPYFAIDRLKNEKFDEGSENDRLRDSLLRFLREHKADSTNTDIMSKL